MITFGCKEYDYLWLQRVLLPLGVMSIITFVCKQRVLLPILCKGLIPLRAKSITNYYNLWVQTV